MTCFFTDKSGPLAQLVEQETLNLCVIGSKPIRPITCTECFVSIIAKKIDGTTSS